MNEIQFTELRWTLEVIPGGVLRIRTPSLTLEDRFAEMVLGPDRAREILEGLLAALADNEGDLNGWSFSFSEENADLGSVAFATRPA